MSQQQSRDLTASDGRLLNYLEWKVEGARGTVAIVHGYAEHAGRYGETAARFNREGYDCCALDVRGHGKSEGARGAILRFAEYFDDLDTFLGRVAEAGKPLFLLGHSHGALIVLRRMLAGPMARPVAKVACTSPFLGVAIPVPGIKLAAGRLLSRVWPSLSLTNQIDPSWVSHDAAVVKAYGSDAQCFKTANARWFTEASAAQDHVVEHAAELPQPVLVVAGGADKIVDVKRTQAMVARAGAKVKYVELAGLYHEVLNETERELAFAEILPWFAG